MKRRLAWVTAVLVAAGCAESQRAGIGPSTPTPDAATPADIAFCVQDINQYRSRLTLTAYFTSDALNTYADLGARQDSASGVAHGHFTSTSGTGAAQGENEFLNQSLTPFTSVQAAIQAAHAQFFAQGPTGADYANLASTSFVQAGCGIAIANGAITIVEDFQ
jgi:hypothetical protein